MSDFKPGDRALVLRCIFPELVGQVGVVTEIYHGPFEDGYTGREVVGVLVHLNIGPASGHGWGPSSLLRLPPDDEAKRLFRETEKPREVSHG